ncbi:MAG: mechanosensitive ion channel family protein [Opitutales bacterium]|nr:mechanosensitive ion channel family protein [Opitutales bacterium]MCH8539659.1 mechanosensitive ion channel family protein [Opitutales bacterium]
MEVEEYLFEWGARIGAALIVMVVGLILARLFGKAVDRGVARSEKIDTGLRYLMVKSVRILILLIAGYAAFDFLGVNLTLFLTAAGGAALAIGLALQGTLTNVASGVMIMIFRPFKVGEVINISAGVFIIDEIGLFITEAHSPDGPMVTIPNSALWGQLVTNFSRSFEDRRRVNETFGISYADDMERAKQIILKIIEGEERFLKDPEPMVAVTKLNDSSVDLIVHAWTERADWWSTRLWFMQKVKEEFDSQNVTIPFPQRDVHLFEEKSVG